ncbi:uncharacterized protein EV420DRAFT_1636860 [Desarmillaria tabescens]|uniref:Uncharacterized protein n=1 Tax=Armillaria tabescens TaxID=1929756 RepID=A0AA39NII7_ARMTA|nr:uncharacterized protein EV420DRAFT_1636860 [Desarmillaria tabescens]KAK0466276.1 hypothetical protein EV420DRAFT_1636860 [Desarmillaria tabescens]
MTRSLDDDISLLNSLLSQDNLDESDEASIAELMQRLESADGVAKGMESKLDDLLGNLDTLLAVLEKNEPVEKQEEPQPQNSILNDYQPPPIDIN